MKPKLSVDLSKGSVELVLFVILTESRLALPNNDLFYFYFGDSF